MTSMNLMPFQGCGLELICSARTITEPLIRQPRMISAGSFLEISAPDALSLASKATDCGLAYPGATEATPDQPPRALVASKPV
ncbi:hypothetical protein SBV1_2530004 [Verrucomicrobia bacterium]|nr:hypothetical protein SBV1_2530004 [Verrucomicrobiota bacterium]